MDKKILLKRIKKVVLLAMGADGILTNGGIFSDESGQTMSRFDVHDGIGIKLLIDKGVKCAIITAHKSKALEHRAKQLGICEIYQDVKDKASVFEAMIKRLGVSGENVAYIGNELNDLPVFKKAGIAIAVADAVSEVKQSAVYVTKKSGGAGAVREVCDLLLHNARTGCRSVGVIPARYGSTRFPGKPLALINGYPLVYHVYLRAMKAGLDDVIIATDDERILKACQKLNCKVVMTSKKHNTGSDRVAEIAFNNSADFFVNIQGDEPVISPYLIDEVAQVLRNDSLIDIATARKRIQTKEEISNPNVVKIVVDINDNVIFCSRAAMPFLCNRDLNEKNNITNHFKHIGIYAYRREVLLSLAQLPPSPLELAESLEQLRALEYGFRMKAIETDYDSIGVDTPEDLEKVKKYIKEKI